jgi:hypothetical protein
MIGQPKAARTRRGSLVFIGFGQRGGEPVLRVRTRSGRVLEKRVDFSQVIDVKNARVQSKAEVAL